MDIATQRDRQQRAMKYANTPGRRDGLGPNQRQRTNPRPPLVCIYQVVHSFLFVNQDRWHEDGCCERVEGVVQVGEDSHSGTDVLPVPRFVLLLRQVTHDRDTEIIELLCEIEEFYLQVALRPRRWRGFRLARTVRGLGNGGGGWGGCGHDVASHG